ncbi:LysR substrate-binding domain-containing protein [Acinetobacter sp. ASP199]|uniref:LysR substrate-binding domain-containing protein n=1 Tax=unclassified Acinetobacter TaxID=196816 RepID=UPI001F6153BA|nr:LysR substrate-binding domain-containing protein [Acinetobacter sp. ASP199]UNT58435.1 LysR family transcriptional regulator [Acinetobacter sp. ASP199]
MELRHLRYFMTVAQQQSFTKAAEKLFTAQPSLSQQIKDLEQEVGVNLFDRSSRKVKLTDEGQAFQIYAEKALENAKLAVAAARQVAQQKNNQIHIGFLNVAEIKVMPQILAQLKKTMPNLKINLHSLTCMEQIQRLKNAELDLCITRFHLDHPDFDNIHLLTEQIYLVAAQHLHPTDRILKLQELKNHNLIMCEQNTSSVFYGKLDQLLGIDQLDHEQVLWVTNVLQHINLTNMGMGFSFAPEYLLRYLNDHVKIIRADEVLPKLDLYATFNKNSQNPALKMITQALNNTINI